MLRAVSIILLSRAVSFAQTVPVSCNSDDCLRVIVNDSSSASTFCETYTVVPTPAFPTLLSACSSSPTRLSSACSCFGSTTTSASTNWKLTTSSSSSSAGSTACHPKSTITLTSVLICESPFLMPETSNYYPKGSAIIREAFLGGRRAVTTVLFPGAFLARTARSSSLT
jgi:hypothetical protein